MRKVKLEITLTMIVDSIADIICVDGPKQIIDSYVSSQLPGSESKDSFEEKGNQLLYTVDLDIVITDRSDANTKMNQIENNLSLLPTVKSLKYRYTEYEKNLNNVPTE